MARLWYEEKGTHEWTDTTSLTVDRLRTAGLTYPKNIRDLWIRIPHIAAGFGLFHAAVFKTLDEANAADFTGGDNDDPGDRLGDQDWLDENNVVAYVTGLAWPSTATTATFDNNANVAPDLSGMGLEIDGDGTAPITDMDGVWGLTATPEVLVGQKIKQVLGEYMGAGQSLEDFTAAKIKITPAGVEIDGIWEKAPNIVGVVTDAEDEAAAAGEFAVVVNFSIGVGVLHTDVETCQENALTHAGNIRSILQANRTLDDVALDTVVSSIDGPNVNGQAGSDLYTMCIVRGLARFPRLTAEGG